MRAVSALLLVLVAGPAAAAAVSMDVYDSEERSMRSSLTETRSLFRDARAIAMSEQKAVFVRLFNSNDAGVLEAYVDSDASGDLSPGDEKRFVRKLSAGVFFADDSVGACGKFFPDSVTLTRHGRAYATPEILLRAKETPVVGCVKLNPLTGRVTTRVIRISR